MSLKYGSNRFQPRVQDVSGQTGWKVVGTIVSLAVMTNTVAIGADAMVGTEKLRVVGIVRIDDPTGNLAGLGLTDGDSLPISAAGAGRIRYDGVSSHLQFSENGGAWQNFGSGGVGPWTDVATVVQLVTLTDTVAIGAAAMVGTEKLYVLGDMLLKGNFNFGLIASPHLGVQRAADDTAGQPLWIVGQQAGANATAPRLGGAVLVWGGGGSDGTGGVVAGAGYTAALYGGAAGTNGGAGGGAGGYALVDAGPGTGAGQHGYVGIGSQSTSTHKTHHITIGNTTENPPTTFAGTGLVTLTAASLVFGASPGASGTIRLTDTNNVTWLNGGVTYALASAQGTGVWIGGPYPLRAVSVNLDASSYIQFAVAGAAKTIQYTTTLTLYIPTLNFDASVVNPYVNQAAPAVDVAATVLTVQAQAGGDSSAGAGKQGGSLDLMGGTGGAGSAGFAAGAGGYIDMWGGNAGVAAAGGGNNGGAIRMRGGQATGAGVNGVISIGYQYTSQINIGNATDNTVIAQVGTGLWSFLGNLSWASTAATPTLYQADLATVAGTGQTMLIHAQDETGGGASTGGALNIRAGNGTTHGVLNLQDAGGTPRITLSANDTILMNGNGAVYVQVSAQYVTVFDAVGLYMYKNIIRFLPSLVAPSIYQEPDTTAGVTGDDLTIAAQDVNSGGAAATAGSLGLRGGQGLGASPDHHGNIWLHVVPAAWRAMEKGMFVANAVVTPTGNPASGGFLYSTAGAGTWRGSGGTISTFGAAGPHCGRCGYDAWTVAAINPLWKSFHYICGHCGAEYKGGPQNIVDLLSYRQKKEMLRDGMSYDEVAEIMKVA